MTDTTQFNKGVQILLERIKSNPEEFTNLDALSHSKSPSRWGHIIRGVCTRTLYPASKEIELPYLSDKEVAAMYEALKPLLAQQFTESIMEELLRDDSSPQKEMFSGAAYRPAPLVYTASNSSIPGTNVNLGQQLMDKLGNLRGKA
jgi:hypothetical protein